VNIFSSILCQ